jgi:membrane-bound metal-dependent hydrolase YbcI (DUF457 family)
VTHGNNPGAVPAYYDRSIGIAPHADGTGARFRYDDAGFAELEIRHGTKLRPAWTSREVSPHRVAMDNLAHALVGAALGRAVADRHIARAGLIGAVAANAPDWTEVFTGFFSWSRADYLVQHRGITHSLAAAALEIVALTLLIGLGTRWRSGRPPRWGWLTLCIAVTLLSHLFMDWQGSYGWRPFLPWNGAWYYLDWVAIADPFFWLLPLIALAWGAERHWLPLLGVLVIGLAITLITALHASRVEPVAPWVLPLYAALCMVAVVGWIRYWFGPVQRQRIAGWAMLALAAYAGGQGIALQSRQREIERTAEGRFGANASWAALTNVGWPFTWEPIYANRDTVASDDWRIPRHVDVPVVREALRDTPEGRAMTLFARFLAADVDSSEMELVYLRDVRYARRAREGWAVLSVRLNSRR